MPSITQPPAFVKGGTPTAGATNGRTALFAETQTSFERGWSRIQYHRARSQLTSAPLFPDLPPRWSPCLRDLGVATVRWPLGILDLGLCVGQCLQLLPLHELLVLQTASQPGRAADFKRCLRLVVPGLRSPSSSGLRSLPARSSRVRRSPRIQRLPRHPPLARCHGGLGRGGVPASSPFLLIASDRTAALRGIRGDK